MIAAFVCDGDDAERELLNQDCRRQIAESCGEDLRMESARDDADLTRAARSERLVNLLYYRFSKGQSVQALRVFRKHCGGAMVMLITDSAVSPLEYLRPGVAPDALLLRPLEAGRLRETNREFVSSFLERFRQSDDKFLVDTREEKILIPWSNIYYFEARDKKLFARTRHEEYAFYGALDKLESRLPDTFWRCHRSYIVNTGKIVRVVFTESYLELADGIGAPLSRGYRARFRDLQGKPEGTP
jgi:DNA-binding LytR/AlgR family response regulator